MKCTFNLLSMIDLTDWLVQVLQELQQIYLFLVEDFNATVLEEFVPANTGTMSYTFEVGLPQDDIIEDEEAFVVVLMVTGGDPTLSITRDCTLIRVQEQFNGRCEDFYKITP